LVAKELGGLGDKNVIDDLWAALSRAHSQQDQALHRGVYFDMRKFYAEAVVALWELGADVDRVEQELKWLRGRDILTRKEISEIRDRIKEKEASVNASPEVPELAAASDASQEVGGIALNAKLMDLQIKRDSHGVPLPISQQPLDRINIQGFVPQIISIQPVDLSALLGLSGSLTGASKDGIVGKI